MSSDVSTLEARIALGIKYATKYFLDPAVVCAVAEQESSWNPWAIRPEPAFETKYVIPLKLSLVETWSRSISWGLMQIMGETARELGFQGPYLSELCDPDVGMDFGTKKLRRCFDEQPNSIENALLAYNGGSNPGYAKEVLDRMSKYY